MKREEWLNIYLREIDKAPPEERQLRRQMIRENLPLVVKIAQEQQSSSGGPLFDLILEGNRGLLKAVERFDPSKGGVFSIYAGWWIRQAIKRCIASKAKKLPFLTAETMHKPKPVQTMPTQESEEDLALSS